MGQERSIFDKQNAPKEELKRVEDQSPRKQDDPGESKEQLQKIFVATTLDRQKERRIVLEKVYARINSVCVKLRMTALTPTEMNDFCFEESKAPFIVRKSCAVVTLPREYRGSAMRETARSSTSKEKENSENVDLKSNSYDFSFHRNGTPVFVTSVGYSLDSNDKTFQGDSFCVSYWSALAVAFNFDEKRFDDCLSNLEEGLLAAFSNIVNLDIEHPVVYELHDHRTNMNDATYHLIVRFKILASFSPNEGKSSAD